MGIIEGNDLWFRYRNEWVIEGIDLSVDEGQALAIIGPNGSGKSTLLKLLSRILVPERGEILFKGRPISDFSRRELSQNMAMVSQEGFFDFPFNVMDVVLMGRAPYLKGFAVEGIGDLKMAKWALKVTDLTDLSERKIVDISGGERQRAFVARALAQDTGLLLLDEPTAYLDINHQISLSKLIRELNRDYKKTIISVTHDINMASSFFDRVVLLSEGTIFADGTPEDVITEENIKRVYNTDVVVDRNPLFDKPRITLTGGFIERTR